MTELVRAAADHGTSLPKGPEERLHVETEGLPFFLVEYLATLAEDT